MRVIRLKEAAVGFGVTVVPLVVLAAMELAFTPQLVSTFYEFGSDEYNNAIPSWRRDLLIFFSTVAAFVALHWLSAAAFSKKCILHVKWANVTLALFIFVLALLSLSGAIRWSEQLRSVCPLLGISKEYTSFGFDMKSPCDLFVYNTQIIGSLALGALTIVFFIASTIIRIAYARRAQQP